MPKTGETTFEERAATWRRSAATLKSAKTVVILGAGAVGVELAGEILTRYPTGKRVMIVDMASNILPGFHDTAVAYAKTWLQQRGAELLLGAPLQHVGAETITLSDGTVVPVCVVYKCVGVMPNGAFLNSSKIGEARSGPRGGVVVNDHLQVEAGAARGCRTVEALSRGSLCISPQSLSRCVHTLKRVLIEELRAYGS